MLTLFIILLFLTPIHSTTIFPNNNQFKCPGNFQQLDGKCVPCKSGTISLNGRCVALDLSFTYGSNVINKTDINCEANRFFFGVCLKCKDGFYLDERSKCQDQALCEIFDLSSYTCLKKIDQDIQIQINTPKINSTKPETETTTGYALSKQQQTKSIQTTFKSSKLQLAPIVQSEVPSLFLPVSDNQQPQTDKVIYFIHESGGQLSVLIDICEIPNNKKCECATYFYNAISGKCIKALDQLILSSNMEYQVVDPYCFEWQLQKSTQKYKCIKCIQNYQLEQQTQQCIAEQPNCINFSQQSSQLCIECLTGFSINTAGKCVQQNFP